jgi:hypothetical protein
MRPAQQFQILNYRRSALSERHDMVILQKPALAAAPGRAGERTAASIAIPNGALDGGGNVTAVCGTARSGPRAANCSMLCLVQFRQQQRQRAIDDDGNVAAGDPMPERSWACRSLS